MQSQTTPKTCSIEGCDKPAGDSRGWCRMHYARWQRHGDPLTVHVGPNVGQTCAVEGCELPAKTRGWCNTHYARWQRRGDVHASAPIVPTLKHGHFGSPTYRTWDAMIQRCLNPRDRNYSIYGGRGITVCKRWRKFENFLADMGERPQNPPEWKGRVAYWSIDRIDNSGNYEPANCRWATKSEQAFNRRPKSY